MNRYLVGTEDGLRSIRAVDGAWETEPAATLRGEKVLCGQSFGTRVVATCYGDGIHISDDGGTSWRKVQDERLKKVRCLVCAEWNGEDVLFAGTEPIGLYISTDGGDSWKEMSAVRELHEQRKWTYPVPGVDPHVRDVVIDEKDKDTLYVAVQVGGVLVGRHGGRDWEEKSRGINLDVHRILIEPTNRSVFYAATGEEGIFASDDGGEEWHRCGEDVPWTYTIPFEMWGPRQLVAGMGRGLPNVWSERDTEAEAALLISKDGGESWSPSFPKETLSSMIMAMAFTSPQRVSVIVATGVTIGAGVDGKGEIYQVDLKTGHWQALVKDLPGINFIIPV